MLSVRALRPGRNQNHREDLILPGFIELHSVGSNLYSSACVPFEAGPHRFLIPEVRIAMETFTPATAKRDWCGQ